MEVSPQGDKLDGGMKLGDRFRDTVREQQTGNTDLLNKKKSSRVYWDLLNLHIKLGVL